MSKKESSDDFLKKLGLILSVLISIITITVSLYLLDERYAKAERVDKISDRLEQKIMTDRLMFLQERMWKLDYKYNGIDNAPSEIRSEYHLLDSEYNNVEKQLNIIIEPY